MAELGYTACGSVLAMPHSTPYWLRRTMSRFGTCLDFSSPAIAAGSLDAMERVRIRLLTRSRTTWYGGGSGSIVRPLFQ